MKYFIPLLFILAGCCPKLTNIETIERVDSVTVFRDTTIYLPARQDSFSVDLQKVVDDNKPVTVKARTKSKAPATLTIVPKDGMSDLIVDIEGYEMTIDSLIKETRVNREKTVTKTVEKCTSQWHRFLQTYFFITVAAFALYIIVLIKRP